MSEFGVVGIHGVTLHHCTDNNYGTVEMDEKGVFKHQICCGCGEERITLSDGVQIGSMFYPALLILVGLWGIPEGHLAALPLGFLSFLPALLVLKAPDYVVSKGNRGDEG
jgi:hypothetical protein